MENVSKIKWTTLFIFVLSAIAFAQDKDTWEKRDIKNEWGDITGITYMQHLIGEGISKTFNDGEPWNIFLQWDGGKSDTLFMPIAVNVLDSYVAPVATFKDEKVSISLRNSKGDIKNFQGVFKEKGSNSGSMLVICKNKQLVELLKKDESFMILIKSTSSANSWQVRAEVKGNLPSQ